MRAASCGFGSRRSERVERGICFVGWSMPKPTKLPWFPMYAETWLTDERVLALSPAERDAYLTMLCLQWRNGSLPFDCIHLYPLLFENTDKRAAVRVLEDFFPPDPDTNRRRNPKLTAIREKQESVLAARIQAASKTNKHKRLHGDRDGDRGGQRPQIVDESFPLREKDSGNRTVLPPDGGPVRGGEPEPVKDIIWRVLETFEPPRKAP